jgi:hypothetical protein
MEEKDLKQADIFYKDDEELVKQTEVALEDNKTIPGNYIEIKLNSLGKLSTPAILHFRNYSGEESVELSMTKEEDILNSLVKCLNNMNYEKFDCSLLHQEELTEILMTILNNYWQTYIEGYKYALDETLIGNDLIDSKNVAIAKFEIKRINTIPINEKFIEPIKIQIGKDIVKFRLPRIKDVLFAKEFIKRKYFIDEKKLSDIEQKIKDNKEVSYDDNEKYEEYKKNKTLDFLKVYESAILVEFNGEKLDTSEKKLEYFSKVDQNFWLEYDKYVMENVKFGIDPNVTFFSPELKKEVIRRFSFQSMDFLPSLGVQATSRATISFGD